MPQFLPTGLPLFPIPSWGLHSPLSRKLNKKNIVYFIKGIAFFFYLKKDFIKIIVLCFLETLNFTIISPGHNPDPDWHDTALDVNTLVSLQTKSCFKEIL